MALSKTWCQRLRKTDKLDPILDEPFDNFRKPIEDHAGHLAPLQAMPALHDLLLLRRVQWQP